MATEKDAVNTRGLVLGGIKGKPIRFSYLNVAEPRLNTNNNKKEYSTTLLIPKGNTEDIKKVEEAIEAQKRATFTDKKKPIPPQFWYPLRDGDTGVDSKGEPLGDECKGNMVLNCKRGAEQSAPGMMDARGQKMLDKTEMKSGDWGAACIDIYGYDKGTGGVAAGLQHVMKIRDGEPLGNAISAERAFAGVEVDEEEEF